jgi:hypothetical protein
MGSTGDALTVKDYLPLIGVLVGGAIAIIGGLISNLWVEWRRDRRLRKSLALAFQGEITALLEIVAKRGYIDGLKEMLRNIENSGEPIIYHFRARREYFSVYKANVSAIGMLRPPLPNLVARFYTQANSILEDIEQFEGVDPSTVDPKLLAKAYRELLALFEDTTNVGKQVVKEVSDQYG